ncbi:hypothetical protein HK101_006330 [Irineochytrium annulatum]|nr:hypothetical protein HK101_006330 [Irineochytrium annulatum]
MAGDFGGAVSRVGKMGASKRDGPVNVLIVDDDAINRRVLQKIIRDLGRRAFDVEFKVSVASNGQEALDAMQEQLFDVVFMDVMMPILNGLEATRIACERWPVVEERPLILILTANAMKADIDATMRAGAE